jgi:chromate transporter
LASKKYPSFFTGGSSHQQGKKDYGPALIDDDTPTQNMPYLVGST